LTIQEELDNIEKLIIRCGEIWWCDSDIGAGQLSVNDPKFNRMVADAFGSLVNLRSLMELNMLTGLNSTLERKEDVLDSI